MKLILAINKQILNIYVMSSRCLHHNFNFIDKPGETVEPGFLDISNLEANKENINFDQSNYSNIFQMLYQLKILITKKNKTLPYYKTTALCLA